MASTPPAAGRGGSLKPPGETTIVFPESRETAQRKKVMWSVGTQPGTQLTKEERQLVGKALPEKQRRMRKQSAFTAFDDGLLILDRV
jgi:hypothetical protein